MKITSDSTKKVLRKIQNGYTYLSVDEFNIRYKRLDTLRVLMEGYEEGSGLSIYKKAVKAANAEHFTGIIRLTFTEKDFLGYRLEDEWLSDYQKSVISFYAKK